MSTAYVYGGQKTWSISTLLHSFIFTITFLLQKGNSDLCYNELIQKLCSVIQSTAQDRICAVFLF